MWTVEDIPNITSGPRGRIWTVEGIPNITRGKGCALQTVKKESKCEEKTKKCENKMKVQLKYYLKQTKRLN